MIESTNTNELQGQYELEDLLPRNEGQREQEWPEGCDAEGNLLNADYPPLHSNDYQSPPSPPEPSPLGEGGTAQAVTDEVVPPNAPTTAPIITDVTNDTPQTSADAARLTTLATEINTITEQTRATVISAALAVGKRLIEAKSICPAGRFGEWLDKAVSYSERKAQDMMRLYEEYGRNGSIPDSIAALDYSKAVALLSAPADQREALAEQAQADDLSVRQLQQEIRRLKDENAKAQQQIEWHECMKERLDNNINKVENDLDEVERQLEAKDDKLKAAKRVIADAAEKVSTAQAKAAAAEASAEELKRLRAEAEERADKNSQNYRDALKRANDTAKELAAAKAKLQALSEAAAAAVPEPERVEVEVVPEEVQRELDQLRRDLAEARATRSGDYQSPSSPAPAATATEKFKWFYANQMKPTFTTALNLLREVAQEDGHAADAFATAMTNACKVLMSQLWTGVE